MKFFCFNKKKQKKKTLVHLLNLEIIVCDCNLRN